LSEDNIFVGTLRLIAVVSEIFIVVFRAKVTVVITVTGADSRAT
jgi:hypothetical protein